MKIFYLPKQSDPKLFVQLNNDQDVYKIYNMIKEKDIVCASASRKISNGNKNSSRLSFLAQVLVEKVEFVRDENNIIKITGQLIQSSDQNIQLHQSQTLLIDKTSKITIIKQSSDDFNLELIEEQDQTNQFAICVICQNYAKFSCQCTNTYIGVKSIQYKYITKTLYNANKIVKVQEKNWQETFKVLSDSIEKYKPTQLFIVTNTMIHQQLQQSEIFQTFLQNHKNIIIDQSYQVTDTNFGKIFQNIVQNNLIQQINKFKASLINEDHQSLIGLDVEKILQTQISSVDVVIISESSMNYEKLQEIINLVKQNQQISLLYTPQNTEIDEYVQQMTGIIALLKYPVYLDTEQNTKIGQPYTEQDWKIFSDL